jgi:hypothetical protein
MLKNLRLGFTEQKEEHHEDGWVSSWSSYIDNNFHTLPESFGELSALKTLTINGSCLKSLPSSISKVEKLEKCSIHGAAFDYSGSMIKEIPERLERFIHLWKW